MSNTTFATIEEFVRSLATDPNVPIYVQEESNRFIAQIEAQEAKRIGSRMKKVAKNVDSKIPRVKFYMPESEED